MSKTRKILSVVLAVAMIFGSAVCAFAAYTPTDTGYTQSWSLADPVAVNETDYTVDVKLTTNYEVGAIEFVITNDNTDGVVLTDVTAGAAITYDADVQFKASNGKVMIIPETNVGDTSCPCTVIDGVIATLTYTLEDASQTANIAIDEAPKGNDPSTIDGTLIALRTKDVIKNGVGVWGQEVTVGAGKVIGAAAEDPELAVIEGTAGVIDTTRTDLAEEGDGLATGYIYGVEPENAEAIEDIFEVTGDGYLDITPSGSGGEYGTGTVVEVKKTSDDTTVATYVLVIFGDIDGDGAITGADAGYAELHDAWAFGDDLRIGNPALIFAGDLDCDGDITGADAGYMELHDAWAYGDNLRLYQADIISML